MRKQYSLKELLPLLDARQLGGDANRTFSSVSTDTRQPLQGSLFVALKGERFDAHDYLDQAVAGGASVLCVSDEAAARRLAPEACLCVVADTRLALLALARWYRSKLCGHIIAVSGSVGKTTTRDMVHAALSAARFAKTAENLNNEIGVAQTLFATDEGAAGLVLELGIGEPGEMAILAELAAPDIAILTQIGHSHIEFFGSQKALAREKLILAESLPAGGWLLLNADDPVLMSWLQGEWLPALCAARGLRVGLISLEAERLPERLSAYPLLGAEALRLGAESSHFTAFWRNGPPRPLTEEIFAATEVAAVAANVAAGASGVPSAAERFPVRLNHYGRHMVQNALFALFCAALLGQNQAAATAGLLNFETTGARQKKLEGKYLTLIDDSYNASPEAMRAALLYLTQLGRERGRRTIAALGCVNELGEAGLVLHQGIGLDIAHSAPELAYLCGPYAEAMASACREEQKRLGMDGRTQLFVFADREPLSAALLPRLRARDILLVKASHSFAMHLLGEAAWQQMEEAGPPVGEEDSE